MDTTILTHAIAALEAGNTPDPDIAAHRATLRDLQTRLPRQADDDAQWPEALRLERLHWLIDTAQAQPMDLGKLARWTGYVQGVACARGWLDADHERERTRPLFHAASVAAGRGTPKTLGPDSPAPLTR